MKHYREVGGTSYDVEIYSFTNNRICRLTSELFFSNMPKKKLESEKETLKGVTEF